MTTDVKKTAESFLNAWEMGCFYKIIDATLHELKSTLKEGKVTAELYESTKQKIEALRYIASTTKNEALKHKAVNNASELEVYVKKMKLILDSKA